MGINNFKFSSDARNPVEVCRLQLLFEFAICPDQAAEGLESRSVEATFVQRFDPFADEHGFPLYLHDGKGKTDMVS